VAEANYPIAHRYYRLKARLLGLPKLATYDQYAPVASNMPPCSFPEGRDTVLEAFERFDPRMREVAQQFFDRRWIDAEVRPTKRGGAFSASTVPSIHPYILVNWTDKLRDVSTLAHELGHGIHQYLSRKQTYFNFHHPLTTAETASVMGEFLTFDHVMETTRDPQVRLGLLCSKIEDAFATVFRQTVLTRFEQLVHNARRQERLSSEQLCEFWWQANGRLYGDAVDMFEPYRWGWAYIPHFVHTPFYCYAYVFGELLVLSLYRMYQEEAVRPPVFRAARVGLDRRPRSAAGPGRGRHLGTRLLAEGARRAGRHGHQGRNTRGRGVSREVRSFRFSVSLSACVKGDAARLCRTRAAPPFFCQRIHETTRCFVRQAGSSSTRRGLPCFSSPSPFLRCSDR
jgi:hypothetical protein